MGLGAPSHCFGSSPHARGTPRPARPRRWHRRFIPACAGNTRIASRAGIKHAVHPRMRGEHSKILILSKLPFGSSPHARGTRPCPGLECRAPRFIPAYAGNTVPQHRQLGAGSVHPRMRGEHCAVDVRNRYAAGSSLHARGTREPDLMPTLNQRFIPACAGNTPAAPAPWAPSAVHPRMRGEHHH